MTITLYVGNRNYSSWSLRPALVLRWSGLPHEEKLVSLDQPGYGHGQIAAVKAISPSGLVPALQVGSLTIWDSLAISEWVAEQAPAATLWPQDPEVRALARAATCEMHSGFAAIRRDMSMNIRRRVDAQAWLHQQGKDWAADVRANLARLDELISGLRQRYAGHGPWLCGTRSIADAFYTPIATRLRTYSVSLSDRTNAYFNHLLEDAAFKAWESRALAEWQPFALAETDRFYGG
jgi:glutathione S-transferase